MSSTTSKPEPEATLSKPRRWVKYLPGKRVRIGILLAILASMAGAFGFMLNMPGKSFSDPLPAVSTGQTLLADTLRSDLQHLAGTIGERNLLNRPEQLEAAAVWIEENLKSAGWPEVEHQVYVVDGQSVRNLIVELPGSEKPEEIVVLGAHYDSSTDGPGANDNGSGTVALLEFARRLSPDLGTTSGRTLRLVFFVNEEPPYFHTEQMGSLVYATRCREAKENIVAMMSLETIGYYSDDKGSQTFPSPIMKAFFPDTGNFIGFVGSTKSKGIIQKVVGAFRDSTQFPSEGAAIPQAVPGVGWSDHWSFEIHGYPALMVTDTAPFRYPYYHTAEDTVDKVDFERMARVVEGVEQVLRKLMAGL